MEIGMAQDSDVLLRIRFMRAQMLHQQAWRRNIVVVHEQEDGRPGSCHPRVFGGCKSAILVLQTVYGQQSLIMPDEGSYILGRAVIDNNDLEFCPRKGLPE